MLAGSPSCTNSARLEVTVARPRNRGGEVIERPASELLPPSQASTSEMKEALSLRSVMRKSLLSILTGTLNRCLVIPGLTGDTSVGPGTASCSAYVLPSEASRGMCEATSDPLRPPGSLRK
jgi:hypothetical protein